MHFDGDTYTPSLDYSRLSTQMERVRAVMLSGMWFTLDRLHALTGDPHASISARIRDLRKNRFGGYTVEHRRHPDYPLDSGIWQYRIVLPDQVEMF